jgi:hypothetical protein
MDNPEPKKIPPGVSPVRYIMSEIGEDDGFQPIKSFEAAKADPDGVVVLESDWGGQILMTARMTGVKCTEKELDQLLIDLDKIAWPCNDGDGTGLFYERAKIGDGIGGGMGGGCVEDPFWVHSSFKDDVYDMDKFRQAIGDILAGRSERLPEALFKPPRKYGGSP